jgi:hypothetical protein
MREAAVAAAAYVAVAVAFWWPLPAHAGTAAIAQPFGDPILNAWTLAWDADRMLHGFARFWTGLFFYPYADTVAYSEHLLGIAVFTAPVQWLTGNPLLALNVAMIGSTALAGFGLFLLARELTDRPDAAFAAGVAFACSPYRVPEASHLQVLMSGWMPVTLYGLHRFLATGSARALMLFTGAFLLQAFSNGYFLYFTAVPVTVVALHGLWRRRDAATRLVPRLTAAVLAILAGLAPVAWAYLRVRREQGLKRLPGDMLLYSPPLEAYAHVSARVRVWAGLLPAGPHEQELFPGLLIALLALVAVWLAARREARESDPSQIHAHLRTWARLYLFVLVLALVLSLGPRPKAFGLQVPFQGPYAWLTASIPGMNGLRVPARLATVVYLALAVLGAIGFAALTAPLGSRSRRWAMLLAAIVIACEGYGGPLRLEAFPTRDMAVDRPAYEWLRSQPRGPMLELPVGDTQMAARHLYRTLVHGNRIVNGYSGYGSALQNFVGGPPFLELPRMDDALRMARALGLRWIVVHPPLYRDPAAGAAIAAAIGESVTHVARVAPFEGAVVFELRPLDPPPSPIDDAWRELTPDSFTADASHNPGTLWRAFDGNRATRWFTGERQQRREWIALRFPAPIDVARVRLEMGRRSNADYPRGLLVEASDDGLAWRALFDGGVLPLLGLSIAREPGTPGIDIVLPPNKARLLRLRTTGETRVWYWSVHELRVWER